MAAAHSKNIFSLLTFIFLVALAVYVRSPGVNWLIGYGYESDYSFHPDDYRFIVSAKDFQNPAAKPSGYPLFMATQLFVAISFLREILHVEFNTAIVLRCISMTYAVLSMILSYVFLRRLGFARQVCILSCFFLSFAPLHIILSHFGTADMCTFFFFYLTIFFAWQYSVFNKDLWLYSCAASAGVTMAAKFFLPSLIPLLIIIFRQPAINIWNRIFVSACVFLTFYCGASFFNFTPWDFVALLNMLISDNFFVDGGEAPFHQVALYGWDMIACSGLVTFGLALIGGLLVLHRRQLLPPPWTCRDLTRRGRIMSHPGLRGRIMSHPGLRARIMLRRPGAVIVLALLFHAVLIITAQVHFARHILVFLPIVCLLAALAVEAASNRLRIASGPTRVLGVMAVTILLAFQFGDGMVTDWIYPADIRARLGAFLAGLAPTDVSTFSAYTHLKGVSVIDDLPDTPIFITCDLEYRRYLLESRGIPAFHVFGGKRRTDFFASLLADRTNYAPIFRVERQRQGLEDHLAALGWLPDIGVFVSYNFVPNECLAFQKRPPQG
jgi:hypothetical protein